MAAILSACEIGVIPATVEVVIAPSASSPALEIAHSHSVPFQVIPYSEQNFGQEVVNTLRHYRVTILCLAGFLRLLPANVLAELPNRILNIHPALLPKFGGEGMYGIHVHRAVLAAREKESGCTVHLVTPVYDEGPILLQRRCPVLPDDTPETLAARVLNLEHEAYPTAIVQLLNELNSESSKVR
jgi:phosphoribosylglycinamide formyltransferase-1